MISALRQVDDPDVHTLAQLAKTLAEDYQKNDRWAGSPFEWILSQPSRTRGAIGERLVAGWAATKGYDVTRPPNTQSDKVIHGHRIEIKFSTLWKNGIYKFQQIRDQQYDFCFCLGLSPFDAEAWLLPKSILQKHVIGHMGQHTGASGTDTAWLSIHSGEPYEWMKPYGGRLQDVASIMSKMEMGAY